MDGCQWIVDAHGCDPVRLADGAVLAALFDRIVAELELKPVRPAQWHVFPPPGGITGVCLLAESHLSVHTFPEHGSACLDLFCCRPRPEWDFAAGLRDSLGAAVVDVRSVVRRYAAGDVERDAVMVDASRLPPTASRAPASSAGASRVPRPASRE